MLEARYFSYRQLLVGVYEGDFRGCVKILGERIAFWFTIWGRNIQDRVQLISKILVVGPQREWISVFCRSSSVHQVQRMPVVIVVLFQNPGFDLRATIRQRDLVELVLDDKD